jgi:hypothetical protein
LTAETERRGEYKFISRKDAKENAYTRISLCRQAGNTDKTDLILQYKNCLTRRNDNPPAAPFVKGESFGSVDFETA